MMFFTNKKRFLSYLAYIFVGTPGWFITGVLVALAPEITKQLSVAEPILVSKGIGYLYIGLCLGDLFTGMLCQWVRSRKKVITIFLCGNIPTIALYLTQTGQSASFYYTLFAVMGFFNGYWIVTITSAAEHFGTNLRSTAVTSVPNFIRAMVIPLSLSVSYLQSHFGLVGATSCVCIVAYVIAFLAIASLEETYANDMNFIELEKPSHLMS